MYQKQISAVEAKQLTDKAIDEFTKKHLPEIMENIFDMIRSHAETECTALWIDDPVEDYRNQHVLRSMIVEILQGLGYKVTVTSETMSIDWGTPMSDATDDQPSQDAIIIRHGV